MNQGLDFIVNKEENSITVKKDFVAELALVWDAFTKTEILEQWWAPKPWQTKTKSMDFREGGHWHYAMSGPNGEEHWVLVNYQKINPHVSFSVIDSFADDNAVINESLPQSRWTITFTREGDVTRVSNYLTYDSLEQLETILAMGFREGYTMTLNYLEGLLVKLSEGR